jgi:hypothetical protein
VPDGRAVHAVDYVGHEVTFDAASPRIRAGHLKIDAFFVLRDVACPSTSLWVAVDQTWDVAFDPG